MKSTFWYTGRLDKWHAILVVLVLVLMSSCSLRGTGNLFKNGDFEKPFNGTWAADWYKNGWENSTDITEYHYEQGPAYSGQRFVTIRNKQENDARIYQYVKVKPSTVYKLSVWVKASGIGNQRLGANICVPDSWAISPDLKETNDQWQETSFYGITGPYQVNMPVTLRLGHEGNTNTGRASFDNATIEQVFSKPANADIKSLSRDPIDQTLIDEYFKTAMPPNLTLQSFPISFLYLILIVAAALIFVALRILKVKFKIAIPPLGNIIEFLKQHFYIPLVLFLFIFFIVFVINNNNLITLDVQLSFILIFAVVVSFSVWLSRQKSFTVNKEVYIWLIIMLGVVVRICYFIFTNHTARQHDIHGAWGHLDYFRYISQHFDLPPVGDWQTYHPPVHYIISAIPYGIMRALGFSDDLGLRAVQMLMIFINSFAVVLAYKIFQQTKCNYTVTFAGVALMAFHPSMVYLSAFLNNDNTLFFFCTLGFFFLVKWYNERTLRNAVWLAIISALAVLSKKTGILLWGVSGIVFIYVLIKERKEWRNWLKQGLVFLAIALPLGLSFQLRNYLLFQQGFDFTALSFGKPLNNSLYHLFYLSPERLFLTPFNNLNDANFFSEFLIKSSLTGEWNFPQLLDISSLMLFLGLANGVILLGYFIFIKKEELKNFMSYDFIFLAALVIPLAMILKLRLDSPYCFVQNFRYIAPMVVLPLAYFWGKALDKFARTGNPVLAISLKVLGAGFLAAAIVFVLLIGPPMLP